MLLIYICMYLPTTIILHSFWWEGRERVFISYRRYAYVCDWLTKGRNEGPGLLKGKVDKHTWKFGSCAWIFALIINFPSSQNIENFLMCVPSKGGGKVGRWRISWEMCMNIKGFCVECPSFILHGENFESDRRKRKRKIGFFFAAVPRGCVWEAEKHMNVSGEKMPTNSMVAFGYMRERNPEFPRFLSYLSSAVYSCWSEARFGWSPSRKKKIKQKNKTHFCAIRAFLTNLALNQGDFFFFFW